MSEKVMARKGNLQVVQSPRGWAVLDPLPDPAAVARRYESDEYYREGGQEWFEKERREYEAGLWNAAYRWQHGLLIDGLWFGALLDVGAGAGWFVKWWRGRNGTAWGIEPSLEARLVNGPRYFAAPDQIISILNSSGLVRWATRFSLVLEHLPDPAAELRRYVQAGASRVLVIVPNEFNPLQKRLLARDPCHLNRVGPDAWFVDRDHLNYFAPAGLRACFRQAGLKVVFEGATFPMEVFPLLGFDYRQVPWDVNPRREALGQKCHLFRLRFEKALGPLAFKLYTYLYHRHGWGRELVFVGEPS